MGLRVLAFHQGREDGRLVRPQGVGASRGDQPGYARGGDVSAANTAGAAATLVIGDAIIQGISKPAKSLTEPLQIGRDNGAKRANISIENKRQFLRVSIDIVEHVESVFYGDPRAASLKAINLS